MKNILTMVVIAVSITACAKMQTQPELPKNMGFTTNGTGQLSYVEFSDRTFGVGCGELPLTRTDCNYDSDVAARRHTP